MNLNHVLQSTNAKADGSKGRIRLRQIRVSKHADNFDRSEPIDLNRQDDNLTVDASKEEAASTCECISLL